MKNILVTLGILLIGTAVFSQIIFETDFTNDGDYFDTGTSLIRHTDLPEGFDGIRTNLGTIQGVPGAGVDGSVALKFDWPGTTTPLATSLFKHLTGDQATGYNDIYIRYNVRISNNFKAGVDGEALPYWKWGRLWQNAGLNGVNWTENRTDSYFIVWNWGDGLPIWGIRNNLIFGENLNTNNLGSAGGPLTGTNWYISGSDTPGHHIEFDGHWDNVGNGEWEFDHTTRNLLNTTTQDWHTFEWRFKLSTTDTSNDGIFQVWFDGIEQFVPNVMGSIDQTIDNPSTTSSLITAAKPGMNLFTLFDNMSGWSNGWSDSGVEGGIYINDLVISTARIGHTYTVLGINDYGKDKNNITVYPSPSSTYFTLKSTLSEVFTISIYNSLGQKLSTFNDIYLNNGFLINVNNWEEGVYYCRVMSSTNYFETVKMIVTR